MKNNRTSHSFIKTLTVLCSGFLTILLMAAQCGTNPPPSFSKPTINSFTASPPSLPAGGGSVTLSWDVKDATTLSIDSGVGAVTGTSKTVSVTSNTSFTLTATNAEGSTTQITSVSVGAGADTSPPTITSIEPQDGATGVTKDANIVITFSEKMDQAATQTAYQSTSLPSSNVTFTWNAESTVMTVKPNAALAYATGTDLNAVTAQSYSFSLTTTAKDSAGNALATVSSSFSTLRRINLSLPNQLETGGTFYNDNTYIIGPQQETQVGYRNGFYGRGYYSVDLSSIPSAVKEEALEVAVLSIHKNGVVGSPYAGPAFNNSVFLDHMNYGNGLNQVGLYSLKNLSEIGVFDSASNGVNGFESKDVTDAVRDDLNNRDSRGSRSQYRLRFPIGTTVSDTTKDAYVGFSSSATIALSYLIP